MMDIRIWSATLAIWAGVSFVLCIAWCAIAPEGWHARAFLELAFPGFTWLSPMSFIVGLIESLVIGAYSGAVIAFVHNRLGKTAAHTEAAAHAVV